MIGLCYWFSTGFSIAMSCLIVSARLGMSLYAIVFPLVFEYSGTITLPLLIPILWSVISLIGSALYYKLSFKYEKIER